MINSYAMTSNSFKLMESDWTLRDCDKSLISNLRYIHILTLMAPRLSSLFLGLRDKHFSVGIAQSTVDETPAQ